ncbi:hypothetical protein ACFXHA_14300 [Nocardia sp. NPDC059240]|uniref:hypothetical protein n=1 Tax=Nocardia sp. NPDC059240 TaxID=3346786 RepID=UPI0036B09BFF
MANTPTQFGGHTLDLSTSQTLVVSMYKLGDDNVLSFGELTFVRSVWGSGSVGRGYHETGGYGSAPIAPDAVISCDEPQCAVTYDDATSYAFTPVTAAVFGANARKKDGLDDGVDAVIRVKDGRIVELRQFATLAARSDPALEPDAAPVSVDPIVDLQFGADDVVTYTDVLYRDHLVPGNVSGSDPNGVERTAPIDPAVLIMCHNEIGPIANGWNASRVPVAASLANVRKLTKSLPVYMRAIMRMRDGKVVDIWQQYVD